LKKRQRKLKKAAKAAQRRERAGAQPETSGRPDILGITPGVQDTAAQAVYNGIGLQGNDT
jgi:hypothetical protein